MTQQKIPLIVDGKEYDLDKLPVEIRNLAVMYRKWENELTERKIEVAKIDSALKYTANEIIAGIRRFEEAQGPTNVT